MGAWGFGAFENDDAADWVYELEESRGSELLASTLSSVNHADYREAPDCSMALAAAEVVAAIRGNPVADLPEEVKSWVDGYDGQVPAELLSLAREAVDHVLVDSELQELWEETDDYERWQASLRNLMERLR